MSECNPPPRVSETEAYYHALYHLVSHWAAYVGIVGVLLTIALLLCLSPVAGEIHYRIVVVAIVVVSSFVAALYFVLQMKSYGYDINAKLPDDYKKRVHLRPYRALTIGIATPAVLTLLDLWLLYKSWK